MKRKVMAMILCVSMGSVCISSSGLTTYGKESLIAEEITIQEIEKGVVSGGNAIIDKLRRNT